MRPNHRLKRWPIEHGILLLDCMVYLGLFFLIGGMALAAFYQANDNSRHLTENAANIVRALQAGARWRADVRNATADPRLTESELATTLVLPQRAGEVQYVFKEGMIYRQTSSGKPTEPIALLAGVKNSVMQADQRKQVTAWRRELELKPSRKGSRVPTLFTFTAVPKKQSRL